MKRILLLGIILAICILAMPQGVLADTALDNVSVNANIQNVLQFTADNAGGSGAWTLIRGTTNTIATGVHFTVNSSRPWNIAVVESPVPTLPEPANGGHMKASTISGSAPYAYIASGKFLSSPFEIQRNSGSYQDLLVGSQETVRQAVADNYVFDKGLQQTVALTDTELPASDSYQIVLKFTCAQTF